MLVHHPVNNQSLSDNNQSDSQQSFSHEDYSVSLSLDSDI